MVKYNVTKDQLLASLQEAGSKRKAAKLLGLPKSVYFDYWDKLVETDEDADEPYSVAVVSDTHWGSKFSNVEAFDDFVEVCKKRGVKTLIHCGDITEGLMPRESAVHDRFLHDVDAIYEYCTGRFNGFVDQFDEIHIIPGNHDDSIGHRTQGFELCHHLSNDFKNVIYSDVIKSGSRMVILAGGLKTLLVHGYSNCSTNLTTRTRGIIARLFNRNAGGFELLLSEHCHSRSVDYWLGVNAYSCGCFQTLTPYQVTKTMNPMVEGYIFTYKMLPEGRLEQITQEVFNYD